MYRITVMSGSYYAVKIDDLGSVAPVGYQSEYEEIQTFVDEGTPVILIDDLNDLDDLGIDPDEVTTVYRD